MFKSKLIYFSLFSAALISGCGSESDDKDDGSDEGKSLISQHTLDAVKNTREGSGGIMLGGTFNFAQSNKHSSLFPSAIVDLSSFQIAEQIHEGLLRYNPKTMEIEHGIIEDYSVSDNEMEYTFKIKEGVRFHDNDCFPEGEGRAVTAHDVKYSFELACAGENVVGKSNYENIFKGAVVGAENYHNGIIDEISGIIVEGDYTIKIQLLEPQPSFKYKLAIVPTAIIAKEAYEAYGNDMKVGVGPFRYVLSSEEEGVLLTRNPHYFRMDEYGNQLPYLDTVRFRLSETRAKQLELFENGKLTIINRLPAHRLSEIVEEKISEIARNPPPPDINLDGNPQLVTQYYAFNLTQSHFKDVRVRQAFNYAIDREKLIRNVLGQAHESGQYGITPPVREMDGYGFDSLANYGYTFNPELAKKLMADAGYPNGEGFPSIELTINADDVHNRVSKEIVKQLRSVLGVNVNENVVPFAQKMEDSKYGRVDMFRSAWVADFPDPETFLANFYGKNVPASLNKPSHPNTTRYVSSAFDEHYESGIASSDQSERFRHFVEAEKIMLQDAPIIVLWYEYNHLLYYTYVRNFLHNSLEYLDLREVYFKQWTKDEWLETYDKK